MLKDTYFLGRNLISCCSHVDFFININTWNDEKNTGSSGSSCDKSWDFQILTNFALQSMKAWNRYQMTNYNTLVVASDWIKVFSDYTIFQITQNFKLKEVDTKLNRSKDQKELSTLSRFGPYAPLTQFPLSFSETEGKPCLK